RAYVWGLDDAAGLVARRVAVHHADRRGRAQAVVDRLGGGCRADGAGALRVYLYGASALDPRGRGGLCRRDPRSSDPERAHVLSSQPSAVSRSAIRSPGSSMPTERRKRSAGTGLPAPSVEARCSNRLSTPPNEVARFQISTRAAAAIAAPSPPLTRIL